MNDMHDQLEYRHKWGKTGPSYLFCKHGDLFFIVIFEPVLDREHSENVSKQNCQQLLFLRNTFLALLALTECKRYVMHIKKEQISSYLQHS